MSRRISSLDKSTVGIDRDVSSEYDNVKIVADNINSVTTVAEQIAVIVAMPDLIADVAQDAQDAQDAATAAQTAQAATEVLYDLFDDRFLGAFATDPVLDNDGDPLVEGALYLHTVNNRLRVYTDTGWIDPVGDALQAAADAQESADVFPDHTNNHPAPTTRDTRNQIAMGADDNYVSDAEKGNLHAPGSDNQTASGVPFTPVGAIEATNVQTAVEELDGDKENVGVAASLDAAHVVLDHSISTGVVNPAAATLSFVDGTRTFSLTPTSDFKILHQGVEHVFTVAGGAQTVVIPNTVGTHFIYFVDGVLTTGMTPWNIKGNWVFVATITWNGTIGAVGDERHGLRDIAWHDWAHHTIGTRYESGLEMFSPSDAVEDKLSFAGGTLHDEDIDIDTAATVRGRLFFNTAADEFSFENLVNNVDADFPYKWNAGTTQVQYMTDAFTWADVNNNDFIVYFYYGSNDITDRNIYVYTPPTASTYNTKSQARRSPPVAGFSPELKLLYRAIFNGNGTFIESEDYRNSSPLPGGGTASTTAAAVSFTPAGSLTTTTVQAAIEELDTHVDEHVTNLELADQVIPEAEFNAVAYANKTMLAGSGMVHSGKMGTSINQVGRGIFTAPTVSNIMFWGNETGVSPWTASYGDSKTDEPVININGATLHLEGSNYGGLNNQIEFPPAPVATNLITNGTFDTDITGISNPAPTRSTLSWDSSQKLKVDATAGDGSEPAFKIEAVLEAGKTYLINYTTDAVVKKMLVNGASVNITLPFKYTPIANSTYIQIYSDVSQSRLFDNISVIDLGKVERQDLVLLETWHEEISDKDFVYDKGCVASLRQTDTATGLSLVAGSFTGKEKYSLSGSWQADNAVVGKGLVWSTMSDANKQKFVADSRNNIYIGEGGELIQVRYRFRVVEGIGADWDHSRLDPQGNFAGIWYQDNTQYLTARGKRVTNDDDLTTGSFFFRPSKHASSLASGISDTGAFVGMYSGGLNINLGYKGICHAIPIALISRRNQGAYDPVFNPNGTGRFEVIGSGANAVWYSDLITYDINSTALCFYIGGAGVAGVSNTAGPVINTGFISSGVTGRPDDKYFDAIYEGDVLDLRNSVQKVTDLKRTLEREFNKLVAGETRGWEKAPKTTKYRTLAKGAVVQQTHSVGTGVLIRELTTSDVSDLPAQGVLTGDNPIAVVKGGSGLWYNAYVHNSGVLRGYLCMPTPAVDIAALLADLSAATQLETIEQAIGGIEYKTTLQCDIIGDPANYYRGSYDYPSSDTSADIVNGEVVKIVAGHDGATGHEGTVGNYYQLQSVGSPYTGLNLSTVAEYGNPVHWTDLGPDREDSWHINGVTGTPLLIGENGEDLIPNGSTQTWKFSRKVKNALFYVYSSDKGQTWSMSTAWNTGAESAANAYTQTIIPAGVVLFFYETEASPFENADNAEVLSLGDVWAGNYHTGFGANLVANLINKIPTASTLKTRASAELFEYMQTTGDKLSTSASNKPIHGDITLSNESPTVKALPYLTRENDKVFLQILFKEMVYDSTKSYPYQWGDDAKFNIVDGVSTTTDDNIKTIQIGQKRLELPYFIGDGE